MMQGFQKGTLNDPEFEKNMEARRKAREAAAAKQKAEEAKKRAKGGGKGAAYKKSDTSEVDIDG